MIKVKYKCKDTELEIECGTNNSSDPSAKNGLSSIAQCILKILEVSSLISIIRYILLPMLF